jgi:uncharacterized protein YuzE
MSIATAPISARVDHEADAAYITLSTNPIVRTIAVTPEVNVDLDDMNMAVGIEVLTLTAEIPYSKLVTEHHIHSKLAEQLQVIQPTVTSFLRRVQVGSSTTQAAQRDGQPVSY